MLTNNSLRSNLNGAGNSREVRYETEQHHAVSVDRAITELRRGRAITLTAHDNNTPQACLMVALETTLPTLVDSLCTATAVRPTLVIASERRAALGLAATGGAESRPLALSPPDIDDGASGDWLQRVAFSTDLAQVRHLLTTASEPSSDSQPLLARFQAAALTLTKHAQLLPAPLLFPWHEGYATAAATLTVSTAAVDAYPTAQAASLIRVSETPVQLADAPDTHFVLFRSGDGAAEHVAVIVAKPDFNQPVLARLHSACLTGDLFGSLRCDCGEQLRKAVRTMAESGGGVLLYLAQEGRNIGLANKLRAYTLQDQGYDTVSADGLLGFTPDERRYPIAAAMLRQLGVQQVRLLTNNPSKIAALAQYGIDVVERVAHTGSVNPHNERYLDTKKQVGHLL